MLTTGRAAVASALKRHVAAPLVRGLALAVERVPSVSTIFQRAVGRPTLHEMSTLAPLTQSPDAFLSTLFGELWDGRRRAVIEENSEVQRELAARSNSSMLRYPSHFTVEDGTALVLYAIVRLMTPHVVVETGVADGRSTATMLAAMQRNGVGVLHSIDISGDVGALVTDRERWTLHVVDPTRALTSTLAAVGAVDVFVHDGDHTRAGQQRDATAAQALLRPGGLFLSDDAEWSYVFHDTCRSIGATPVLLVDTRKVFGAVRLP
jgi:predicted O-methyltransferase YrrM